MKKYNFFLSVLLLIMLAGGGYLFWQNQQLSQQLGRQIEENRKVYIYSLDEVLLKVEALESKRKFEEDVTKLNDELLEAEEKIKNIQDANLQEDFSVVYLKNLRMKRDDLVNNYQKSIEDLTTKINEALASIAKEKDISVVFLKSSIAATSPYVVDITEEVVNRIKK